MIVNKKDIEPYIDRNDRYQSRLQVIHLYPKRTDKKCACGCGKKLEGRRTRWATKECQEKAMDEFWVLKGDMRIIRRKLYGKDKGVCQQCGEDNKYGDWEADHIIPVSKGGGGYGMENYQTLCRKCNRSKSNKYGDDKPKKEIAKQEINQLQLF